MEPAKSFVASVRRDLKDRKSLVNAARFACVFAASFLIFLYAVIPLTAGLWQGLGAFHAQAAQAVLSFFGIPSSVSGNVLTLDVQGESTSFEISQLCSGDVEIALLASLLIATLDVLLIWRVAGILLGAGTLLLLNPLRIALTLAITRDSGIGAGDFYHSVIFRLFLFIILVIYYFAWYRLSAGRSSKAQQKISKWLRKRLGY